MSESSTHTSNLVSPSCEHCSYGALLAAHLFASQWVQTIMCMSRLMTISLGLINSPNEAGRTDDNVDLGWGNMIAAG